LTVGVAVASMWFIGSLVSLDPTHVIHRLARE
jgi:hypothetical protein